MAGSGGFYKMTGSGNDFIMLDGRATTLAEWPADRIQAACDRRNGVGADGLVLLNPEAPATVRMTFFNCDGSRAEMCGNAALCSTRLAARLGLAPADGMELRTDAGTFATRCIGSDHLAEINLPPFANPREVPEIEPGAGERLIAFATVGVPHLVVLVDDVSRVALDSRGRELRSHPALRPAGANANFVSPPAVQQPNAPWHIRTFERGVEGETLACGTGTVAAAVALALAGRLALPATFLSAAGLPLTVSARLGPTTASEVWLLGEGRLVFEGTLL